MAKQVVPVPEGDLKAFIELLVRSLNENFDHLDGQGSHVVAQFKKLEERIIELEDAVNVDVVPEHDHSAEDEGDTTLQPVTDHIADAADAHDASAISYAGGTGMSATDVEAAVDELATEKADVASAVMDGDVAGGDLGGTYPNPTVTDDSHSHGAGTAPGTSHPDLATHDALGLATDAELAAHTGDTTDAHDASAISFTPAGSIAATDVQAAIEEVAAEGGGGGQAFPVGSVFISVVSTNPATLLGYGTWSAFATGRTLVGIDAGQTEFDTVEETGGAKTHTLTESEIPSHQHTQNARENSAAGVSSQLMRGSATGTNNDVNTGLTGGGGAHNNLQPYIVVYMWKRTA